MLFQVTYLECASIRQDNMWWCEKNIQGFQSEWGLRFSSLSWFNASGEAAVARKNKLKITEELLLIIDVGSISATKNAADS